MQRSDGNKNRSSSAEKATATSTKRCRLNISNSGERKNERSDDKKKETTDGYDLGVENMVPSTVVTQIDPVEARAIDNRAWSAFMEKWSSVVLTPNENNDIRRSGITVTR